MLLKNNLLSNLGPLDQRVQIPLLVNRKQNKHRKLILYVAEKHRILKMNNTVAVKKKKRKFLMVKKKRKLFSDSENHSLFIDDDAISES